MNIEWGSPGNFAWLWILPVTAAIFFLAGLRRKARIKHFGEEPLVERLITSLDGRKRLFKRALLILALLFIVLALAQPHFRTKEVLRERKGIDLMILVDVSQSMLAKDIPPTRLDKAKLELEALVERMKQDRIGIVAFAGDAFIQCPLTVDKSAVKLFLSTLNPNIVPAPGTAIGRALQVGLRAFEDTEREHKAMILLTDGEDHGSAPLELASEAKKAGVRIFTIGIGTADGGTLPSEFGPGGLKKDLRGEIVLSKLDEPLLKKIAAETGGVYYRASRGEFEIDSLSREIRQMAQKGFAKDKSVEYEENYQYFLIVALLVLFLEIVLSERKKNDAGMSLQRAEK